MRDIFCASRGMKCLAAGLGASNSCPMRTIHSCSTLTIGNQVCRCGGYPTWWAHENHNATANVSLSAAFYAEGDGNQFEGVASLDMSERTFRCTVPPVPNPFTATVHLKIGEGAWIPSSSEFTFTQVPKIISFSPPHGPRSGNTTVTFLASDVAHSSTLVCMFGPDVVPARFVAGFAANESLRVGTFECTTLFSAQGAGAVAFQISSNGQQFSAKGTFVFYEECVIWGVEPSASPTRGDAPLAVVGRNFYLSDTITCRFAHINGTLPPAYSAGRNDARSDTVVCSLPPPRRWGQVRSC